MQICVYDWYQSSGEGVLVIPREQGDLQSVLVDIVTELQDTHGNRLQIENAYCDVNDPYNQLVIARNGITTFPAIGIVGEYDDGTEAAFFLENKSKKPINGVEFTRENLAGYVRGILYKEIGENTIFCRMVKLFGAPQLCQWEKWLWLGVGTLALNSAITTDNPGKKVGYGSGAAVSFWRFYKMGGLDDIQQLFKK